MEDKEKTFINVKSEDKKEGWECDGCGCFNPYALDRCIGCDIPYGVSFPDPAKPSTNPILDAYYRGEKVRAKAWLIDQYVVNVEVKDNDTMYNLNDKDPFSGQFLRRMYETPELWELYQEPVRTYSGAREVMQALLDGKRLIIIDHINEMQMWVNSDGMLCTNGYDTTVGFGITDCTWTEVPNES